MFGIRDGVKIRTSPEGSFKDAINGAGWLEEEVIAAGHLRQGQAARSQLARTYEQLQMLLPRRSKKLPRHFVLAVTENEVVAFRCTEVSQNANAAVYQRLKILAGVKYRYPYDSVSLADLPDGAKSSGGIITVEGESFPVMRPNPYGDPNTDELMAVLADLPMPAGPQG